MAKKPVIALMYDFDKTLSPSDMQKYAFMAQVGTDAEHFWAECDQLARSQDMDSNLAYLYLMIQKAKAKGIVPTREWMVNLGKTVILYPGLTKWFERMTQYGESLGAIVEHYIISSGVKEIIEGTSIAKAFTRIYACEYLYDEKGVAVWPKCVVNYTTKTQFLFRISKGTFALADNKVINQHVPETEKHCPFRNMIYIGDGTTDIPCMQLVRSRGGESIAVYPPKDSKDPKGKDENVKATAQALLKDNRVSFMERADYSQNSGLDKTVKEIIARMVVADRLAQKHYAQTNALPTDEEDK